MDILIDNKNGKTLKTKDTYSNEDINVIPVLEDVEATSNNADGITPSDGYAGIGKVIVNVPIPESEEKTVDLNMASGNQVISPSTNKVMSKVTVNKPATLLSQNIKKGVGIGGVVGTLEQKKDEQEKTITVTENGSASVQPDSGKVLSKVIVNVNVPSSGGADLNIYYGETAPEDTSKLWIKSSEPENITFTANPEQRINGIEDNLVLPSAMYGMCADSVGSDIYIIQGSTTSSKNTTSVYKYNTLTKVIEQETALSSARLLYAGCAAVGKNIYTFGGYNYSTFLSTIYRYNTLEKSWKAITSMDDPCIYPAVSAIGTKIYIFGGTKSSNNFLNSIQIFDTETNGISLLGTSLPEKMTQVGSAVVGTDIYLFGGYTGTGTNNIWKFDTLTNTITTLEVTLPGIVTSCRTHVIGSKIFIFYLNKIYEFDTLTETITELSQTLPHLKYGAGGSIGSSAYLIGGLSQDVSRKDIVTFTVTFPLAENDILIQEGYLKNTFDLVQAPTKVEMSAQNAYKGNANGEAEFVDAYVFNKSYWKNINTEEKLPIYALSAPADLSLSVSTLTWAAVDNAKTYEIFSDGASLGTATTNSIDLSTLSSWATITAGTHSLAVKAKSDEYLDSPASSAVTLTMYSIDTSGIIGATVADSDPKAIVSGGSATLNITATQYTLPLNYEENIIVNGADFSYVIADDLQTATLTLSNATSNVSISLNTNAQTAIVTMIFDSNVTQVAVKGDLDSTATTLTESAKGTYVKVSGGTATITATYTLADNYEIDTATVGGYKGGDTTNYTVKSVVGNVVTIENTSSSGIYDVDLTVATKAALTQLLAPQNVTVDGTTASWDEVENAEEYEIFVDGTSIGTTTGEIEV